MSNLAKKRAIEAKLRDPASTEAEKAAARKMLERFVHTEETNKSILWSYRLPTEYAGIDRLQTLTAILRLKNERPDLNIRMMGDIIYSSDKTVLENIRTIVNRDLSAQRARQFTNAARQKAFQEMKTKQSFWSKIKEFFV